MKIMNAGACVGFVAAAWLGASSPAPAGVAEQVIRSKASGIDLIIYPMGVRDVLTIAGSLPAGDVFAAGEGANLAVATMVGMLLDKGTTRRDKFAIAKQLNGVGAQLAFHVGSQTVEAQGKVLKKDAALVIRLMAEQLRSPEFSAEEFAKAKKQLEGSLRSMLEDPKTRATESFARAIYPHGHPNRPSSLTEWLDATERLTLDEVKAFHAKYYGPAHLSLIFAGDVDAGLIQTEVTRAFAGWTGGVGVTRSAKAGLVPAPQEHAIALEDKASVAVTLGQPTGLRARDADRLALAVGTAVLGSGFTGRLMSTVRDKEGLTYGLGASLGEDAFVDGSWSITAEFAPALLEKGVASTRRELDKWYREGITAEELEARKTNMVGTFQVSLATTGGMVGAMLNALDRGLPLSWIDEYPQRVQALTVAQVNAAIKKYLDPQKMVLVKAGTFAATPAAP